MARQATGRGRMAKDGGGQASMLSSIINLLNTIIGAGTLAMPAAMSHFGIMLGVLLIIWCGVTSAFGLYLQARCARYLDRGTSSFFALSQISYPNVAVLFDAAIAIKCFGVGVSYLIIIGDLMPGVMTALGAVSEEMDFLTDRNFWITAFMFIIIPLSFLRKLESLKYTSIIALLSIGYLIILILYHFIVDTHADPGEIRIIAAAGPVAVLSSIPVVIFAYTCHQNMFSILNELKDNSPPSIVSVIGSSMGSAAGIYILVAITGYLTFGNKIADNVVSMYPANFASTIAKASIVVLVTFSVPLQVHPCRASIDAVLRWQPSRKESSDSTRLPRSRSGTPSPSHRYVRPGPVDSHGPPILTMSELRFAILTSTIIVLSYLTAVNVTNLGRVLAYVGSTGSTSISFILPGLFYHKISDPNNRNLLHHAKIDDDADVTSSSEDDESPETSGSTMLESVHSIASANSNVSASSHPHSRWRWRRKWRWDLEHLETDLLRRLALCLAGYGITVMVVCLAMNTFFIVAH